MVNDVAIIGPAWVIMSEDVFFNTLTSRIFRFAETWIKKTLK